MSPSAFVHKQLSYFIGTPQAQPLFLFRRPGHCSPMFRQERATSVLRRTEVLAWTFMILVAMWIIVDAQVFPPAVVKPLAIGRLVAVVGLGAMLVASLLTVRRASATGAYLTLLGLLAVPSLFAWFAQPLLDTLQQGGHATPAEAAAIALYRQLPLIYVAGLALFPLTLTESLPILLAVAGMTLAADTRGGGLGTVSPAQWADIWILLIAGGAAALAGVLQFNLLWQKHCVQDYESGLGLMKRDAALAALKLSWLEEDGRARQAIGVAVVAPAAEVPGTQPSLALRAEELLQALPSGMLPVLWSDNQVGVLALGPAATRLESFMSGLYGTPAQAPGLPPRFAIADRGADHAVSPLNLVNIAEQKLRRYERREPAARAATG